jgi:hypothetical protein
MKQLSPVLSILFFVLPSVVSAQVVITEIMYDPIGKDGGREWIEVYNTSTAPIPLTTWKIYESDTNHAITGASSTSTLAPSSYAIIANNTARFRVDYPAFSGALFHASFSLSNSSDALSVRDAALKTIDSVSYTSAAGGKEDGNSLQRLPSATGAFVARTPSPSTLMSTVVVVAPTPTPPPPTPVVAQMVPIRSPAAPPSHTKTKVKKQKKPYTTTPPVVSPLVADVSSAGENTTDIVMRAKAAATEESHQSNQVASPVSTVSSANYGWYGALALVFLSAGAVVASRQFQKSEWDIVDETDADT